MSGRKYAEIFLCYHSQQSEKLISKIMRLKFPFTSRSIELAKSTYIQILVPYIWTIYRSLIYLFIVHRSYFVLECSGVLVLSEKIVCLNIQCAPRRGFLHKCAHLHEHKHFYFLFCLSKFFHVYKVKLKQRRRSGGFKVQKVIQWIENNVYLVQTFCSLI